MYSDEEVVRPYVRALVQAARDRKMMARVRADMEALERQWNGSPELRTWCTEAHSVPRQAHTDFVDAVWGDTMSPPVIVLLKSLSLYGLLGSVPALLRSFRRFADAAEGRIRVSVTFAAEPSEKTVALMRKKALNAYGDSAEMDVSIDPSIGAGLIVRAGNTQIDGSLAGRLRRLRNQFARAKRG